MMQIIFTRIVGLRLSSKKFSMYFCLTTKAITKLLYKKAFHPVK